MSWLHDVVMVGVFLGLDYARRGMRVTSDTIVYLLCLEDGISDEQFIGKAELEDDL